MTSTTLDRMVSGEVRANMARKDPRVTISQLAKQAGIAERSLAGYLSGERGWTVAAMERVARALNVPPGTLIPQQAA